MLMPLDNALDPRRRPVPLSTAAAAGSSLLPAMQPFAQKPTITPPTTVPTAGAPKPPSIAAPLITPAQQQLNAQPPALTTGTDAKAPAPPRPMILPPVPGPGDLQPPTPNPGVLPPPELGGGAATGPLTDFGPGNDLRYTQINPADDPHTTQYTGLLDTAAAKLGASPNLAQAGLDKLAELRQGLSEDRRKGMQDIGRSAAAFGRLGSGVTTSQLGDLEATLQARELAAEKGLAGDLTTQEAADRRANVGTLQSLQDQIFGQGAQRRNELRGERGYEYGVGTDAYNRELQSRLAEEDLKNSQFGRNVTAAELGLQGAGQYDQSAQDASGSAADLAGTLAMYNARGLTPSAAAVTTPPPQGYKWVGGRLVPVDAAPAQ